jgi:hypothetical protein
MKKLLGILVLFLLWCNISFADDKHLDDFNQWLFDNNYHQYVSLNEDECAGCSDYSTRKVENCFDKDGPKKQCWIEGDGVGVGEGKWKDTKSSFFNPTAYAGFFHTNYSGMKKRAVLGMDGFGGQQIIIDFDRSRIVVINSIHQNYNWKKIAHSVIKKGK